MEENTNIKNKFEEYIKDPESYLSQFNQDNKQIKDFFKKLFILSYERENPIFIEDTNQTEKQYELINENKNKVFELSKKLGMSDTETQMLFFERSIVEGFFKDIIDVKIYITRDHEKLKNLLIDIFSSLRYTITSTKRLRDLYSLSNEEVEELLKGIEFKFIDDLLPETSKSIFFSNVFEYFKKKGNPYYFKELLKYFIYSRSVGVLNEWWLEYDGNEKTESSISKFKFIAKPIWNPKEYYYDYPNVSISYSAMIENDPHWYYDKEGNPSIAKVFARSEDNILPSLTSYLSFNYFVIESNMIKDLSVFYKRLNEYNKFFFINTLMEQETIDRTDIKNIFIKEDKTDNILILLNNGSFVKKTLTPLEYILINNNVYAMSIDEKIFSIEKGFIDFIPEEYKIKEDKRILHQYMEDYFTLPLEILKSLRFIYINPLKTYASELELYYLLHFLNRGKFFHRYNFLGKFENFDLNFNSGYEEGDYIEYNNRHYIFHDQQWWELYYPMYSLEEQKSKLLFSRSVVFLRELDYDKITETNLITEYNPSKLFSFLNIDYSDPQFNTFLKKYFPGIDLSCLTMDNRVEVIKYIIPFNIFSTRNQINEEYKNITTIEIPNFIKKFLLKNYWTLGECISEEDSTEFLDTSSLDYRNISYSSFSESIMKVLQETSRRKYLDRFFIFPNDNDSIFTGFEKCVKPEKDISKHIKIDNKKEEIIYDIGYQRVFKGVVFIEADPSYMFISGNSETIYSFLSNIEFKFDVILEEPINYLTLRIYFIFEDPNDKSLYKDVYIYKNETITINTKDLEDYYKNTKTAFIQKIGIELINYETKSPSSFKIKNIKINLSKNILSCKDFLNRFENGLRLRRIDDTHIESNENIRIIRPYTSSRPILILPRDQIIVKDKSSIDEDELINIPYTQLFNNGLLFSDITDTTIHKNRIEFCALFSNNIPAKPFIFFIYLPLDFLEIFRGQELTEKEDIVRFSFFYNALGLFNNLVDLEIIGFSVDDVAGLGRELRVKSFDDLVNLCYNKSDKYFKLIISSSGKYYTFFNYKKVNVIGFKFTPKQNIEFNNEHCFLYAVLEDFKLDRDIVLSERKFPSDLARYDVDILKLLNYDLANKVKEKIESFYFESDKLYKQFESFKETIYNDLFDFYKDNDVGISTRIREMPNLISNNFQLKKCIKLLKYYKPIFSKLLEPMFFYEKEEKFQNKINLRHRLWLSYKQLVKESPLNIKSKIFTTEYIKLLEPQIDKLDSFKRNMDDIVYINYKQEFNYIKNSSILTQFISFPLKLQQIDREVFKKELSIQKNVDDFIYTINKVFADLEDTTLLSYKISYPFMPGINIIQKEIPNIPIIDITNYILPNIYFFEDSIIIDTSNIENETHFMLSFTNETVYYKILLDKLNNSITIFDMEIDLKNSDPILNYISLDTTVLYYPYIPDATNKIYLTNLVDYVLLDETSYIPNCIIQINPDENIITNQNTFMLINRPVSGLFFKLNPNEKIEFINTKIKTVI